jgi:hypothetical protein
MIMRQRLKTTMTASRVRRISWLRFGAACALLFIGHAAMSAQTFKNNGTAGFTFLEVPVSARTAALGESSLALTDQGAASVFDNGAALGFTPDKHTVSASYAPWFADIKQYGFSYALNTGEGVVGIGMVLFDYGSMPRTAVGQGQKVFETMGTFGAKSIAIGITYSRRLTDRFSFGTTVKFCQETIDIYKASNILFDGGVLYYTGLGSFRIAACIQNFGVNAKFINDEFKMPSVLKLGAAVDVLGGNDAETVVTVMAEALHPNDAPEKVNVGGEITWRKQLAVRGGWKFFTDEESYSLGIGFSPFAGGPFSLDFAHSDYGRLGKISRLSVQFVIP